MSKRPAYLRITSRPLAVGLIAVAVVALAGCGSSSPSESGSNPTPEPTTKSTAAPGTEIPTTNTASTPASSNGTLRVWFLDAEGAELVSESRPSATPEPDLRAVLEALAEGPQTPAGVAALPTGTEIVGTNIAGEEALINFNQAFVSGYPSGGAAAELAVLAPIVYSATEVTGVARVRITVDGQTPQLPGTQFDFSNAFTRADFPDLGVTP